MIELLTHSVILAADTFEGDGGLWLLALGPAGAVGLYWMLYRFYRNTDKSHAYERETLVEAQPVTGDDRKVDEVRGVSNSSISGNNVNRFRDRVRRLPPSRTDG
ncbi:MAG TPA: hypothetical protein VNQ48_02780 [Microbacteriaceae bacterium]|nr:hypothetical protein [Microbacteriaceae bacterium]